MANAARHFPLRTTQKMLDVTMLIITAFSIDAPRIVLSMQIARAQNSRQPGMRGPAQVFQFNPSPFNNPSTPASPPNSAAPSPIRPAEDAGGPSNHVEVSPAQEEV
jgi:hypothetical protein